jgi:crotonobetainyl-CoA:carnitine CoA-transferase CaiB-like acyl-CoA transferase
MFLDGIRVLELTIAWAGPFAGLQLGDLGAQVVLIEAPTSRGLDLTPSERVRIEKELASWSWGQLPGPSIRGMYPDADPGERPWNRNGHFNQFNRNKLSLCMDMKHPEAPGVFRDLVRVSDVVLSNFSVEGQRHLGIDHQALAAINPMIITIHLTGYGLTGPNSLRRSWGPILEGHSGFAAATGYEGGGPMKMGVALPDAVGGLHAVVATLGALRMRDELGHGLEVDVSQLETYSSYGGEAYLAAAVSGQAAPPRGNRALDAVPQGVYPCIGTDEWVAISVETDQEWAALVAKVGPGGPLGLGASLADRRARQAAIDGWISEWSVRRTKQEAMHILQTAGVRAGAVLTNKEFVEDPHTVARGFMVEWDQVDVGVRSYPGTPIHAAGATMPLRGTASLGADNHYVLTEILGYPESTVVALSEAGLLATSPPEPD